MLDEVTVPRLVIAGVRSGEGKTTVALGLVAALCRRGRTVQTYKVGPDLVDSAYLAHVSRRPCRNLDSWLLGDAGVRRSLSSGTVGADCAVIEGVMGVFDCHGLRPDASRSVGGHRFPGSTAEVAELAGAPVILVLDVSSMGETAAALALGVRRLDPALPLIGVLLNNVPSDHRRRLVEDAVWDLAKLPVLGALPRIEAMAIPEWHLGLLPVTENPRIDEAILHLAAATERHCDLDLIERLMVQARPISAPARRTLNPPAASVRLGVAFDDAFCFYYSENLELLEEAGAEIVPFSPLDERSLPRDIDGLYFGGGFSPVFAPRLSANRSMMESVRRAHALGLPIYAESGGLLYLSRSVRTKDDTVHEMAGVVQAHVAMDGGEPRAGYRELRLMSDCLLGPAGTRLRGHEFHVSSVLGGNDWARPVYSMHHSDGEPLGCEGWTSGSTVVSFVHLHFGQEPGIAERFTSRMFEARRTRQSGIKEAMPV
jgi:cobyrinic acid a,c-diamide synthase